MEADIVRTEKNKKQVPFIGQVVSYYTADPVHEPENPGAVKINAAIVTGWPEYDPVTDPDPTLPATTINLAVFVEGQGVVWKKRVPYGFGKDGHWS